MKNKNLIFSAFAIVVFAILAMVYSSPVLSDNSIIQPDIVNYKGSAQEMQNFKDQTGENTYWSNAMFGGMPTYQTGAQYDFDLIKAIDHFIRFLPRPADYIFLLFAGFFILGMVLFKNWKYAFAGSVFFAVGAYFFIIIGAGHNAKVHAIAYFAPLVAGIILLYQRKFILGFLLTALFMGLELSANHPQMTYYLFLVMLVYFIFELIQAFKTKEIKSFAISTGLLIGACMIGVGLNSTRLLTTYEYSQETIRGKSEMTLLNDKNDGLDHGYITNWSYGKLETFNLFIPNFMGGGSQPKEENLKNYVAEIQKQQYVVDLNDEFNSQMFQYIATSPVSTYWGDQPGTSGPAYQGAVVVFLFLLGLFLVRNNWSRYKWWLFAATVLSIILAWGKNFEGLTNFMIDYFPMYDKFRAVSSMLVMAEFTMPLLAALTLYVFFKDENLTDEYKKKILIYAGGGTVAVLVLFYVAGGSLFDFSNEYDLMSKQQYLEVVKQYNQQAYGTWDTVLNNLEKALKQDRIDLFKADTLRTLLFVILTLALLFLYQLKKIKQPIVVVLGIAGLALIDGWQIDKRYLNDENFVDKMFVESPFPTQISTKLMEGASKNYHLAGIAQKVAFNKSLDSLKQADQSQFRVFDNVNSTFNDATTSYFVNSIGGYHGAKLHNYQDVIDMYFSGSEKTKQLGISTVHIQKILNLLNTKYIVHGNLQSPMVQQNNEAFGNAWLVSNVKWVQNANDEILALKDENLRSTVILQSNLQSKIGKGFLPDTNSTIQLKSYQPNKLVYSTNINSPKIAVFSEIYYPHGWTIKVDGKEREILKANYFLRAVQLEPGDKEIVMEFQPNSVKIGNYATLSFNIAFLLFVVTGGFFWWKQRKESSSL
ncbi:YfhO family protein [Moheibacter lacus]|uniref:YfhO family protein n=1 Tax=Moheibacter lacus TaxID=2745851 RepID=A0A838ZSG4_9FLAO|nr:YfhO family protein [Moheibacter lacus]MBA5629799.1 YfhO family protein [Moheibacter lacus]